MLYQIRQEKSPWLPCGKVYPQNTYLIHGSHWGRKGISYVQPLQESVCSKKSRIWSLMAYYLLGVIFGKRHPTFRKWTGVYFGMFTSNGSGKKTGKKSKKPQFKIERISGSDIGLFYSHKQYKGTWGRIMATQFSMSSGV